MNRVGRATIKERIEVSFFLELAIFKEAQIHQKVFTELTWKQVLWRFYLRLTTFNFNNQIGEGFWNKLRFWTFRSFFASVEKKKEKVKNGKDFLCNFFLLCLHIFNKSLQNFSALSMVIQQCFGKVCHLWNLLNLNSKFINLKSLSNQFLICLTSFSNKWYIPIWACCKDSANFSSAPLISSSGYKVSFNKLLLFIWYFIEITSCSLTPFAIKV